MSSKILAPEQEVALRGEGITKAFGGLVAVNNVDIALRKTEILGLIGPNGAGKTTLFNMLSGTMPMTRGALYYNGKRISRVQAHKMCGLGIGRTYQICQPFGNLTVLENVMVGAYLHHPKTADARDASYEILKRVGLEEQAQFSGSSLTLPQLKRMEVARALATQPGVLLLDEVIAGLNPIEVEKIMELIREIRSDGISIIIIEHVMRAMMNLSDRIIVINQGTKIAEGLPEDIAQNEQVIASYLGGGKHAKSN